MSEDQTQIEIKDAANINTDQAAHLGGVVVPAANRYVLYGNELQRQEDLNGWTYEDFKNKLIAINNEVTEGHRAPGDDFYEGINMMGAGWMGMAGVDVHFPLPEDRKELLQYALEKAQNAKDLQDAAMILGISVVAIHPFADGNGRTSRALYAQLSRGWDKTVDDYRRVTKSHGEDEQGDEAREEVDLGSVFQGGTIGAYADWYPYMVNDLDKTKAPLARYDRDAEQKIKFPTYEQLSHLDNADYNLICQAIGIDKDGSLRTTDVRGLQFALAKVLQEHGLADQYLIPPDETTSKFFAGINFPKVNLAELLRDEEANIGHELAEAIREYRKLRAVAAIDFATDETGGQLKVKDDKGDILTLKDLIARDTNNYKLTQEVVS